MDKVVDHLLVFKGDGVIKDFPGNYTQYRTWLSLKTKEDSQVTRSPRNNQNNQSTPSKPDSQNNQKKRKLSFNEKREFEQIEKEIEALETEKKELEEALCSGTLSIEALTEKSKRLPKLQEELDEKSMRWLELSEWA
jgi:ATP-binding cassette subfamily F protein uup